jgi:TPR repeat protein
LEAEDLDLKTATAGEYSAVFNQLAEGLEYTADGEIVVSTGKRLPYNDATRIALIHYIAKQNPTVTFVVTRKCSTCSGVGSGVRFEGREGADLGYQVHWVCKACNGRPTYSETLSRRVVYSGELPQKWDSPRVMAFRGRLRDAGDGSSAAQLEVGAGYMDGKHVPKNLESARQWFTKAAIQGEKAALAPLAQLYLDDANSFHDRAFGLALRALALPEAVQVAGADFVSLKDEANEASLPEAGLIRHLHVLEAGALAPLIAKGLRDKALAEKVLMPDTVRIAFPAKAPLAADTVLDARAAYARAVAYYFGFGFSKPDKEEALRLFEIAAGKRDADALLLLGMHFDAGRVYPASPATAWAYYAVAARAGATEPYAGRRLRMFAETEIAADWEGAPEVLFDHFQTGNIPPMMFRQLADLSLYRTLRSLGAAPASAKPFDTATSQERPLSKPEVFNRSRTLLMQKLRVIEIAEEDVSVVRKCWDDGITRFYSVSGIVTFTDETSRREVAPYTLCFKLNDLSSPPVLMFLSAGSARFGEFPLQCGRRP